MTERELARRIRQIDRNRAAAYELIASTAWGDRRGYDLCVNTTNLNIKEITPLLVAYAEQWFRTREKLKTESSFPIILLIKNCSASCCRPS